MEVAVQDGQTATQSLFPVGWIHTHPAFDCFLSSVDMHNQFGYQASPKSHILVESFRVYHCFRVFTYTTL